MKILRIVLLCIACAIIGVSLDPGSAPGLVERIVAITLGIIFFFVALPIRFKLHD